ncbi:MAG: hypothetical protein JXN59_11190 [Anaerolineae bacterium]|nr:hypothetical protein [Anaerolineae bacterium]
MNNQVENVPHLFHRPASDAPVGALLAASADLNRTHWDECWRLAPLQVPPVRESSSGVVGFYRGQVVDFVAAHAYRDAEGLPLVHYALLNATLARRLAGRPALLAALLEGAKAPPAIAEGEPIPALAWKPFPSATEDEQAADLSTFVFQANDDFKVVESVLAALIQGRQIAIVHAPLALADRLVFIQGLLTLLPVPARYGVTYTTYADRQTAGVTQIVFMAGDLAPAGAVVYDWAARQFSGALPEEGYSRFILQQLRLDPNVAIQQVTALTRTAAWRLKQGEGLAQALGWAARRVALDAAVTEGLPANTEHVARVLREDETLTPDLRLRYVRHVLGFMLALGEFEHAETVGLLAESHEDVSSSMAIMLEDAISEGKEGAVFGLIEAWQQMPGCPNSSRWQRIGREAALAHLRALSEAHDIDRAAAFLERLQGAGAIFQTRSALAAMFEAAMPLAAESPTIAGRVVLMAAEHLDADKFRVLLEDEVLRRQLPPAFGGMLDHFQPGLPTAAPAGLLLSGAGAFGSAHAPLLLGRLAQWVMQLDRPDLIDTPVLEGLLALAGTPYWERFAGTIQEVVAGVSKSGMLSLLEDRGPQLLVELQLRLGDYRGVVGLLERISTTRYRGEAQAEFGPWVRSIFTRTGLDPEALVDAVEMMTRSGLKPVPAVMAQQGALTGHVADPVFAPLVESLSQRLLADGHLIRLVGYDMPIQLVQFYAQKQDEDRAVSLAAEITSTLGGSEQGLQVVGRLWSILSWNHDVREAALELMRRYVRQVPVEKAGRLPELTGRRLGERVGQMIQATYVMNIITAGAGLEGLAHDLRITVDLLMDLVATYEQEALPTLHRLTSDLDALTGGASRADLDQIGDDLLAIARLVWDLGGEDLRTRKPETTETLLASQAVPRTGLEALLWLGGYLCEDGEPFTPEVQREAIPHVLGGRSVNMLMIELDAAHSLLARLQRAFASGMPALTDAAFAAEIESLWKGMRLYDRRQLGAALEEDAQTLPFLVRRIAERGSARALEQGGLGRNLERARREPRSVMEALRLLHGYFKRQF